MSFLHEDFTGNDFFLDLAFDVGRHGAARAFDLLLERFDALLWNCLAVNNGDILGGNGQGQRAQHGSGNEAGQELFLHAESKK